MSSSKKQSAASRFGGNLIYYSAKAVGLLPWWFLYYVLAEPIYFLLYYVARYRLKVVRANLTSAFPEKGKRELRRIERRFYRNLSEYFIDAIDFAGITEKQWKRRANFLGLDELAAEIGDRNWIDMLAHFGSWEFFGGYGLHPAMGKMAGAYRPLKNKALDLYYHKMRNRFPKVNAVPMNDLLRFYMKYKDGVDGKPISLALIADQHSPVDSQSQWIPFLNHTTVFFHGGEKIARKFGLPVYFMHTRKVKRSHYELWFEQIWDGATPIEPHEITNRYAALLEAEIRECPELWMWSHKRWKWRLEGPELEEFNRKWGTNIPVWDLY